MKTYKIEEISEIVGGILTKVTDASIDKLRPPLLADENALALALSEEEIENIAKTHAKVALVPLGVNFEHISTIEVERPRLAMMKLLHSVIWLVQMMTIVSGHHLKYRLIIEKHIGQMLHIRQQMQQQNQQQLLRQFLLRLRIRMQHIQLNV